MDNAMVAQLLATYGAPPTPENVAAAKNFFAANPDVAERRAMGMRGSGIDDNSDVFAAQLDKLMQQTAPQSAPPVSTPPSQTATAPPVAQPRGPMQQAAPSPSRQGNYGPAPDMLARMINEQSPPSTPQAPQDNDSGLWQWLLPLLGVAAGSQRTMGPNAPTGRAMQQYQGPEAEFVGRMPRGADAALEGQQGRIGGYTQMGQERIPSAPSQIEGGRARISAPQGRIEDRTPRGNYESVGREMEDVRNREANRRSANERQIREDISLENEQAQRLMEQMRNRQRAQANTEALLRQSKKAFGGR